MTIAETEPADEAGDEEEEKDENVEMSKNFGYAKVPKSILNSIQEQIKEVHTDKKKLAKKHSEALFKNYAQIAKNNKLKDIIDKVLKVNKDIHKQCTNMTTKVSEFKIKNLAYEKQVKKLENNR